MKYLACALALLLGVSACGSRQAQDTGGADAAGNLPRGMELLRAVPSDASALMCFDCCSDGLKALLDSTDALRGCVPSRLGRSRMVMALGYNGSVVPLLILEAPKDTSAAVTALLENAAASGLSSCYLSSRDLGSGHGMILVSRSETLVESSRRHLQSATSILDAPGFAEALAAVPSTGPAVLFWNNSAAAKWLRKDCLKAYFKRSDVVGFVQGASEWTMAVPCGDVSFNSADIITTPGSSEGRYLRFLSALQASESRLAPVLPAGTSMALSLVVADPGEFRQSYGRYLDANVRLAKYNSARSALKKTYTQDPEDWAAEYDFREVALVHWDGKAVLLARPAKHSVAYATKFNSHPGYCIGIFLQKHFSSRM